MNFVHTVVKSMSWSFNTDLVLCLFTVNYILVVGWKTYGSEKCKGLGVQENRNTICTQSSF